nr:MAG TPA: hypothetical protein [Bacteriophage sp.]
MRASPLPLLTTFSMWAYTRVIGTDRKEIRNDPHQRSR